MTKQELLNFILMDNNQNDNVIFSSFSAIVGSVVYMNFADIGKALIIAFISGFVGHFGTKAARYLIKFFHDQKYM